MHKILYRKYDDVSSFKLKMESQKKRKVKGDIEISEIDMIGHSLSLGIFKGYKPTFPQGVLFYLSMIEMALGLSMKSHDPSQRSNGFLTLAGGVIITFAREILTLITG
jgi:hypothetical protein